MRAVPGYAPHQWFEASREPAADPPRSPSTMPRLLKMVLLSLVACLLPAFALLAHQPPPAAPPNQPTAKEVIKAIEKQEGSAKASSDPIERIKEEGLKRSQVMATLSYLTDVIGPRLTGS